MDEKKSPPKFVTDANYRNDLTRPKNNGGSPAFRSESVRHSYGMLVCRRRNPESAAASLIASARQRSCAFDVLVVHKRYTYEFSDFLHGRYYVRTPASVAELLAGMTHDELMDVWSLKFEQMWFRVWAEVRPGPRDGDKKATDGDDLFSRKKKKYQYLVSDGGRRLRAAIAQTRGVGVLPWELPGGGCAKKESGLACALRELKEETGLLKRDIRLVPGATREVMFTHRGVRYVKTYFVALANPWVSGKNPLDVPLRRTAKPARDGSWWADQASEISEARWLDIVSIRALDGPDRRLQTLVAPALVVVRKYLKGTWGVPPPRTVVPRRDSADRSAPRAKTDATTPKATVVVLRNDPVVQLRTKPSRGPAEDAKETTLAALCPSDAKSRLEHTFQQPNGSNRPLAQNSDAAATCSDAAPASPAAPASAAAKPPEELVWTEVISKRKRRQRR